MTERYTYGEAWKKWWLAGLVFGLTIIGVILLRQTTVTLLERPLYESTSKFQILRSQLKTADMRLASDHFIANEVEKVRSSENAYRVVDRLDLTTRWKVDRNEAADVLRESLSVENIPNSDIVEVRIRHVNPEDSRDMANEIVAQYAERRRAVNRSRAEKKQLAMDSLLREQEDRVEEMKKVYDHVVKLAGDSVTPEERHDILRAEEELMDKKKFLREMRLLNSEKRAELRMPNDAVELLDYARLSREAVSADTGSSFSRALKLGLPWSVLAFLTTPFLFRLSCTKKEAAE